MSRLPRRIAKGIISAIALLAAGCASVDRTVERGRDPAALREIFVAENLNDNHALSRRLADALRARGVRAESGPLTMRPATAEAVLGYQDRWAWDFGDHMVHLRLTLRDPEEARPYATADYSHHIARTTDLNAVVPELVGKLLAPAPVAE